MLTAHTGHGTVSVTRENTNFLMSGEKTCLFNKSFIHKIRNTLNYQENHLILLFRQFFSRCNLSHLELHKIAANLTSYSNFHLSVIVKHVLRNIRVKKFPILMKI